MAVPLSEREQRAALAFAAVGFGGFVALLHDSPALLAIGAAMTGGLAIAAWRRNRLGTAIAAFVTAFGPWSFFYIVGVAYVGLAFWLARAGRQVLDERAGGEARRRTSDNNGADRGGARR